VSLSERKRHKPYEGRTVTVTWGGKDRHTPERIEHAVVIAAGESKLWVFAPGEGVKVPQDVFIPYDTIISIIEEPPADV
jgi:hypothetical protein